MSATLSRRDFGTAAAGTALAVKEYYRTLENRILGPEDAESHGVVRPMSLAGHGERFRKAREARGLTVEQCAYVIDPFNVNFWYAHWQHLEGNGYCGDGVFMEVWPTIEALLGVSIAQLIYGGSDVAQARAWCSERLNEFEPDTDIEPDKEIEATSKRVKQARESCGLSVAEAAKKAGVTERDWQRYENGGMPVGYRPMIAMSQALNVVDPLWFWRGDKATGQTPAA